MGVYLYAVCEADAAVVPARVSPREHLRLVVSDGLAALVSDDRETPPSPSVDDLWEHERVVETLMGSCDVLPARYGTELDDNDAVARLLHGRRDALAAGLRHVGGAVELAIRAELTSAPQGRDLADPADGRVGTAYIAAALAREHRARALAQTIHTALADVARDGRIRPTAQPVLGCAGAYLVPRARQAAFRERVEQLDAELGDAQITCTGPWPPYSFAQPSGAQS